MKILSRTTVVYNTIIFVLFSYAYAILLSWSNIFELNFNSIYQLIEYRLNGSITIPLLTILIISIYKQYKFSVILLIIYLLILNYYSNSIIFYRFDKIILLSNILVILSSYYFVELWSRYIGLSPFNPGIKSNNVINERTFKIKVNIVSKGINYKGDLVNYDSEGCFVKLNENLASLSQKVIDINFIINKRVLNTKMKIVSKNSLGIGLIEHVNNDTFLWYDIYEVLFKRRYLK